VYVALNKELTMKLIYRKATLNDLSEIIRMLASDKLGKLREKHIIPLPIRYIEAFNKINEDQNQELIVVENEQSEIVGTLQVSFLQYLTYQGGIRAQIEAVRIDEKHRNKGLGKQFFLWAIEKAKIKGAHVVQLTTDKKRPEAKAFYLKLGFIDSHEGMKLHL
jgi:GNAT superfamily N-acetyltransferase